MNCLEKTDREQDAILTMQNINRLSHYANKMGWPATAFYLSLASMELNEMLKNNQDIQTSITKSVHT